MHETPSDNCITLHRGTKVRKCHTSKRDAFKSVNAQPIAKIQDQKITILIDDYKKRIASQKLAVKPEFNDKVALLRFYPGMNPKAVDWYVDHDYKGMVLEGTGLGHVGNYCYEALKKAVKQGIIIVMTSQCIWGRVNMNVYDSGRDLQALDVIPLEDMLAETALVKLMWIFGQTSDVEEAKKLLKTNIAGEFSPRTLPEEIGD
jgi:glutamyl-tRNA(Gln) amidotransferase subunit D